MPEPLHRRPDLHDCIHVGYDFPEHDEPGVMVDLWAYIGKLENYNAYFRVWGPGEESANYKARVFEQDDTPTDPRWRRVYDAWQHSLTQQETHDGTDNNSLCD
jgi:hypothetical protein